MNQPSTHAGFKGEGQRLDYIESLERDYAHGRCAQPAGRRDEIADAIVQSGGTDPSQRFSSSWP